MKNFIKIFISIFLIVAANNVFSQVAINTDGSAPNGKAMLDVVSTSKGILIPRLSTAQRTGISPTAAEEGLTVYDTDTDCYWLYSGSAWVKFSTSGDGWSVVGNGGTNPTTNFIGTTDGQDLVFKTSSIERARIMSDGNFGVGTSTPSAKLHTVLSGNNMTQVLGTVAAFQKDGEVGDWARVSIIGGNKGASVLDFGDADLQNIGMLKYDHKDNYLSYSYNNTEIMRIEDYGYVGINTTNPTERLDVGGAVRVGTTTNLNVGTIRWSGTNFEGYDGSNWVSLTGSGGNWTLSGSDIYRNTGKVGIGTTAPSAQLHVNLSGSTMSMTNGTVAAFQDNGATNHWANISIIGGNAGASLLHFGDADDQDVGSIRYDHTNNYMTFFTNASERIRILNDGKVGIGTTTPGEMLEVNGSIKMTDGNQAAGNTMVSDANGKASWSNENDGVKTRVIRQINGGASTEVTIWSHPEGIDVKFDPGTETVTVVNNTGDASDYWDIVIEGDARTGSGSIGSDRYIKNFRKDGESITYDLGTVDSGWFNITASDQNDEKDGFVMHIVYYGDDLNGIVQYWDNN